VLSVVENGRASPNQSLPDRYWSFTVEVQTPEGIGADSIIDVKPRHSPMMKRLFSNQKGFTLLEVLIAITILSVGLLALAEMTVYVIRSNAVGNKVTDATVLAQDKLEKLKNLSYTDAQLDDTDSNTADVSTNIHSTPTLFTSPDHSDAYPNDATGHAVTIGPSPQRVWNVAADTPASGMKTVTVIVGWNDSINHFVALSTIIGE